MQKHSATHRSLSQCYVHNVISSFLAVLLHWLWMLFVRCLSSQIIKVITFRKSVPLLDTAFCLTLHTCRWRCKQLPRHGGFNNRWRPRPVNVSHICVSWSSLCTFPVRPWHKTFLFISLFCRACQVCVLLVSLNRSRPIPLFPRRELHRHCSWYAIGK
jgi:hypothetical protein